MTTLPTPIAILISGRGSNMQAIVGAIASGTLAARVCVVVSNRAEAPGLAWARAQGLNTLVLSHRDCPTREAYDAELVSALREHGAELVCLAGFMRVLGPTFCKAFPSAVVNVHPSLLPSFPGKEAQRQAFEYGVKVTGVTVHFVTPVLDGGPIIRQEAVAVRGDDTVETLSARLLAVEHRLFPEAIQSVIQGDWRLDARRVVRSDEVHDA